MKTHKIFTKSLFGLAVSLITLIIIFSITIKVFSQSRGNINISAQPSIGKVPLTINSSYSVPYTPDIVYGTLRVEIHQNQYYRIQL